MNFYVIFLAYVLCPLNNNNDNNNNLRSLSFMHHFLLLYDAEDDNLAYVGKVFGLQIHFGILKL